MNVNLQFNGYDCRIEVSKTNAGNSLVKVRDVLFGELMTVIPVTSVNLEKGILEFKTCEENETLLESLVEAELVTDTNERRVLGEMEFATCQVVSKDFEELIKESK